LVGIYTGAGGVPEAMASIGAGVTVLLLVHFQTAGQGFGLLSPTLAGVCAAALCFALVLLARKGRQSRPILPRVGSTRLERASLLMQPPVQFRCRIDASVPGIAVGGLACAAGLRRSQAPGDFSDRPARSRAH
jgi:hypothetical protein